MQAAAYVRICTLMMLAQFSLTGCGGGGSEGNQSPSPQPTPQAYSYSVPSQLNDGWTPADAQSVGVDVAKLTSLMDRIYQQQFGYRRIDGMIIVQHNKLLFEQRVRTELDVGDSWANNTDLDLHVVNSVTKSVMSLALGIAIEQGLISSLDASIYDYLTPNNNIANWDERKADITIRNYLTMRHGYEWDEWNVNYLDSSNLNARMNNAADPIQFLLDRPMASEPGTTFAYSTGVSYALGIMLANASDSTFYHYLYNELLRPLGINKVDYWALQGELHGGSSLYLSMRAMAKIGQLVLDGGRWQGVQVVPESWVAESTANWVALSQTSDLSYGYQWWGRSYLRDGEALHAVVANGFGGQLIYIFPDLDAVIVFTGSRYNDGDEDETDIPSILETYVLPALPKP